MRKYPSNTAIPRYYAEFKKQVVKGYIPVCENISLEMNRIDDRIANPDFYFDQRPVESYIRFCERELTKTDGSELKLLDSFKLWAEQLYGWFYYSTRNVYKEDKLTGQKGFVEERYLKRLINKQYVILGRGGAKSMYGTTIQGYALIIDPETTHQIVTAPTMKQGEETINPLKTAIIRAQGPLFQFLTSQIKEVANVKSFVNNQGVMLASTKRGIEFFPTNSILEIRPMTIDKLQSLRTKVAVIDEWLSGDTREDVVGAIEQGSSKLEDWMIIAISSEGTVRNGAGDDIKLELLSILNGEYIDPHTSIFYYRLDDVSEIANPDMWVKAQPNIGYTVSYETYHKEVARAENVPSTRNDTIAKRFGIPVEGYTYFFKYEQTRPHTPRTFSTNDCAMGVDLSQGDDFCSFTFLFPLQHDLFGITSISFITERTLALLPPTMRAKYDTFLKEHSLIVLPGRVLDMEEVFYTLDDEITKRDYNILTMGYDPYNADVFLKLYIQTYGEHNAHVVRQGARTESVPLGEIYKLAQDRRLIFHEDIFSFAMGHCMAIEDTNGNLKLWKKRREHKIDPVSALLDAYVAYKIDVEEFF